MRQAADRGQVVEVFLQERASGEWTAVVTDRTTGRRSEAHSVSELEAVLQRIIEARTAPRRLGKRRLSLR
jgi:hypothetical protein